MTARQQTMFLGLAYFLAFASDQILKYKFRLQGGFYVCNQGISLGIHLEKRSLGLLSLLFILWLIYFVFHASNKPLQLAFILIIVGALSNILDRLIWGCVLDYIHLASFLPSFNLADIWISLGAFLVFIQLFSNKRV